MFYLRIASFYFTLGVDRYNKNNLEDAVDLFTTSYIVNDRLIEDPIPCKSKELKVVILNENNIPSICVRIL